MKKPHRKVSVMTLLGALATTASAISKGTVDPATIGAAVLTVVQFAAGYVTPAHRAKAEEIVKDVARIIEVPIEPITVSVPVQIVPGAHESHIVLRGVIATGVATGTSEEAVTARPVG